MPPHNRAEAEDARLREVEMSLQKLQTEFDQHMRWADRRSTNVDDIQKVLTELRMEIHGAKIGGKVALGLALTIGSLVGWLISLVWK